MHFKFSEKFAEDIDVRFKKVALLLSVLLPFSLIGADAFAASGKKREVKSFTGKIGSIKSNRDKKKRRYWEYKLKLPSGESVVVHDYKTGKTRQPASAGLREGVKKRVKGFFVNAITVPGSNEKTRVLIIAN